MEDDLELEHEGAAPGSTSQPVRRNISLKLKAKSKSASSLSSGKSKKKEGKSGEKSRTGSEGDKESKRKEKYPGTAVTAQVVVIRELKWDHQILPIGQKVQDPLLHLCEKCSLPIPVYGRLCYSAGVSPMVSCDQYLNCCNKIVVEFSGIQIIDYSG
ncbi:uncharacterized protein [Porites lutea]|uniref:uncharacterized protein n=1 Tax=Porites lutea TaxID=51062 RepID=UPI003CC52D1F